MMNNLTIVIPVYNEGDNIAQALSVIEHEIKAEHLINVIYDFDEETSIPVIKAEKNKYKNQINLIKNKYGHGVLNAIKTGLDTSETEYVIVTMADLSDPPELMNKMLDIAVTQNADIVCASRYMKGGKQIGGPFVKRIMSRIAGLSLYHLAKLPTHDATNSYKLYRTSFLKKQNIESTGGFEIGLELVVKAHLQGFKVSETPTVWTDRKAGKSNFKIIDWLPSYLKWYLMAFLKSLQKKKTSA